MNILNYVLQMKVNEKNLIYFKYELLNNLISDIDKLLPIIIHLLLSTSFSILSTQSNQQESLLNIRFQLIENIFKTSINEILSHRIMITIMKLRTNRKLNFIK